MRNWYLWIAFAFILGGCGDEPVRPDRDEQTPPGTGGSGGGLYGGPSGKVGTDAATQGQGGTAGTSDAAGQGEGGTAGTSDETGQGEGSTSIPLPNCNALCVWEVEVSGDCPANATEECLASFQAVAATQGPTCLANLEAWCLCLRNNTDASLVSCTGGPVTSNIPVINGEVPACSAETQAWSACS